jgi:hypothetical protein
MKLEFSKKSLEVVFDGKAYNVSFPTIKEANEYAKNFSKADSAEAKDEVLFLFLEKLGLPKEIVEQFYVEQLEQVIDVLLLQKKI